uniref:ZCF37 n=1 Tax=Oryza punctata TaxID=4537 RepID=A0A0E0KFD1_ORYPU
MLCGTASFKHVDDDDDPAARGTGGGSPKQPRRKHGGGKANPYAERGLDKFSTVLSELEARRNMILRRVGSGSGLVMVRFVQSNGALEPIIVKLPDEQRPKDEAAKKPRPSTAAQQGSPASPREGAAAAPALASRAPPGPASRASSFSWGRMRRPAWYWPAVMVLMLVCLAVFGRVFAICCTSIWWYIAPTLLSNAAAGEDARPPSKSMEKRRTVSPPPANARKLVGRRGTHKVGSSPRGYTNKGT